jgi:hypothetical protein
MQYDISFRKHIKLYRTSNFWNINHDSFCFTNSVAFSPQANYTDWATATDQRILVPNFVDRGMLRGQCDGIPTAVNLSFLDRSRYFFFKVAPNLSSQGLRESRSRPIATQNIW